MSKIKKRLILILAAAMLLCVAFSSAFEINGTVYDLYGNPLSNANVTVYLKGPDWSDMGVNATTTNASGWFNLTVSENVNWFYQLQIVHFASGGYADYVGQSLPPFGYPEFSTLGGGLKFFLRPAGTINITAVNASGARIPFNYDVKDTKLGYPVASSNQGTEQITIYVPRDRNYSIMIYPAQPDQGFIPVSFSWDNFSSPTSYNIGLASSYNATTKTLSKQFDTTMAMRRVTGFINKSGISGWDEMTIVPMLFEGGDIVALQYGILPYNMSQWNIPPGSDFYNRSTGFYNITLPDCPAETVRYILFAAAKNGSEYYGSFKNITMNGNAALNFTMYGLLGELANITMTDAGNGDSINVTTKKQTFNIINESGNYVSGSMHIELTVDYSNYGAREFTFVYDLEGTGHSFAFPLLSATGVKEINVYSNRYAPKSVSGLSVSAISSNNNITVRNFEPEEIDGELQSANVSIAMYISNSTCDVPNPPASCIVASSSSFDNFQPLSAIVGGGKLSFRMGSGGVFIHYVNVDLLASGPPDILFDKNENGSVSDGSFSKALRFGSTGPKIYDYVLISLPYTTEAGTGLNESAPVNMSIPLLYGDSWTTPIWNASANGTDASALAGNHSHYAARQDEWSHLLSATTCTDNSSSSWFNATNPCYIDKDNNRIWIRLPHFSGTKPNIQGSSVASSSSDEEDTDSGSSDTGGSSTSGSGTTTQTKSTWTAKFFLDDLRAKKGYTKALKEKYALKFRISGEMHIVGVKEITNTTAKINISSPKTYEEVFHIGEEKKYDLNENTYYDLLVRLDNITDGKAVVTVKVLNDTEKVKIEFAKPKEEKKEEKPAESEKQEQPQEEAKPKEEVEEKKERSLWWVWLIAGIVIIAGTAGFIIWKKKSKQFSS